MTALKKTVLIVLCLLIIFLIILFFFPRTTTKGEYAYILAAKKNDSLYSIIAYDINNEKYSIIKTDAYLIKDDLPDQLLAATREGDYLTLYSIHNGEMTPYKENIYCPDIEFIIAYMDSYVYYTRRNWFGLYDIVRLSPDGTLFQYAIPGDGLSIYRATGGTQKIPYIADVDHEGRIVYTYTKSGSADRIYMSNLSGEYYCLGIGYSGIWLNQDTILYWSDILNDLSPDAYRYSLPDESSSLFFTLVFKDIRRSIFISSNASIKDENTIAIACEKYPIMYPIWGYPTLSFGLFDSETGKCISQYSIKKKNFEFCDNRVYWE